MKKLFLSILIIAYSSMYSIISAKETVIIDKFEGSVSYNYLATLNHKIEEAIVNSDRFDIISAEYTATYRISGNVTEIRTYSGTSNDKHINIADIKFQIKIMKGDNVVGVETVEISEKGSPAGKGLFGEEYDATSSAEVLKDAFNSAYYKVKNIISRYFPIYGEIVELVKTKKDKVYEVHIKVDTPDGLSATNYFIAYVYTTIAGEKVPKEIGGLEVKDVITNKIALCKVLGGKKQILSAIRNSEQVFIKSVTFKPETGSTKFPF